MSGWQSRIIDFKLSVGTTPRGDQLELAATAFLPAPAWSRVADWSMMVAWDLGSRA